MLQSMDLLRDMPQVKTLCRRLARAAFGKLASWLAGILTASPLLLLYREFEGPPQSFKIDQLV